MGCWGTDIFGNDDAEEFLVSCLRSQNPSLISETLENNRFTESEIPWLGEESALAAAEVIAAKLGHPGEDFPDNPEALEDLENLKLEITSPLITLAIEVVERIQADSHLKDKWLTDDDVREWSLGLDNLLRRLRHLLTIVPRTQS